MGAGPTTSSAHSKSTFQSSENSLLRKSESTDKIFSIQARADKQGPPEVRFSYLDVSQGSESGLIVVTPKSVENFSPEGGFRRWQIKWDDFEDEIIAAHLFEGKLIIGFENGKIFILDAKTIRIEKTMTLRLNSDKFTSEKLTTLIAPFENMIICGFSSGNAIYYFLDSGEVARTYLWSHQTPSVTSSDHEKLTRPAERGPTAVIAISILNSKQWIALGYASKKILSNLTESGQTRLVNLTPPIALFSLDKQRLLARMYSVEENVIYLSLFEIKNVNGFIYVMAVLPKLLRIWELSTDKMPTEKSPTEITEFALNIEFSSVTPPALVTLGNCSSASFDVDDLVVFLLFDRGFIVAVQLTQHVVSELNKSRLSFSIYRLFKVGLSSDEHIQIDNSNTIQTSVDGTLNKFTCLGYDRISQTLIVGDAYGTVFIAADTFGKFRAMQALRLTDNSQMESAIQTSGFVPTLYVGRRKPYSWFTQ